MLTRKLSKGFESRRIVKVVHGSISQVDELFPPFESGRPQ